MARRARRFGPIIAVVVLGALMLGGYTVAAAQAPVNIATVTFHDDAERPYVMSDEAARSIVDTQSLPTAIGYAHTETVWSNDDDALPLASITKLVSMLVALDHAPLDPDASTWGTHAWSLDDWNRQQEYIADLGVAFPTTVGAEIPLEDMLTLIFLPSANDMVSAFTYRVFPDNAAFITAVEAWAAEHHLASLRIIEPTGLDERNVASPADALRIGRMALEHPVIARFLATPVATVPGYGLIENTNPLVGNTPGVVGVKTGRSASAGFNLIVAQDADLEGRAFTQLSVTMGRASLAEREASGREMLALLDTLPTQVDLVEPGTEVGVIIDWQERSYPIVTDAAVSATLLPGETATRSVNYTLEEGSSGTGSVTVMTPGEDFESDLYTTYEHSEPSLWWRLTHPSIIFQ